MNPSADREKLAETIGLFRPRQHAQTRCLALFSAAIASAEPQILLRAIENGRRYGVNRQQFYEIVLQSYLFLGFPRMLIAAECLAEMLPATETSSVLHEVTPDESRRWFDEGVRLCRRVYGQTYELLRERVESIAPEIFRWMVLEGYGKVLSRDGVGVIDRELAVIASLMMENRARQLHSHIRGAVNVGTAPELVRTVIDDIGPAAGAGYATSREILERLGPS